MTSLLNNLSVAIKSDDDKNIETALNSILKDCKELKLSDNSIIRSLLEYKQLDIVKLSVKLIAELAKSECNRAFLTDQIILSILLSTLNNEDEDLLANTIRALCNITYENKEAAEIIGQTGFNTVLSILNNEDPTNGTIHTNASVFLMNLIISKEDFQKTAVKCDIFKMIENLLKKYVDVYSNNEMLFNFLLSILNTFCDSLEDSNNFTVEMCVLIIKVFKLSKNNPEIGLLCLEILHGQAERDDLKIIMAEKGTCEYVIELIEQYKSQASDADCRVVLKMACDFIVIILTGDDCMNLLYNEGNGAVYKHMIDWLKSDDVDLLSTGILAIGNFARNDIHCIQMVKNGVSKKLIELLAKYNTPESDIKVQHALLSTLKNLVIPQQNKAQVLEEGLINVLDPLFKTDQYMVIFKLLGTLRMVIDKQESAALDLISRKDLLEKLIYWCNNSDHLGVRGEIPRLLSWLVKHCHSVKPIPNFISVEGTVKCITEMVSSNHAVMQNESFSALCLLCVSIENENERDNLYHQLIEAEIGNNINFVITKYSDKMERQTIENLLTLIENLIKSDLVAKHLKSAKVDEAVQIFLNNSNINGIEDRIRTIATEIVKGG